MSARSSALFAARNVGSDGEQPRVSYMTYVPQRMSGFSGVSHRKQLMDMVRFPKYAEMYTKRTWSGREDQPRILNCPQAVDKVRYDPDLRDASFELDAFDRSLARNKSRGALAETFVTAISPGMISVVNLRAEHSPAYPTDREYVLDLAHEMKKEYELIVSRGHLLQLDAPDLAMERQFMFQDRPMSEFLKRVELAPVTPNSITDAAVLRKNIEDVRQSGIAFYDGEFNPEVRCIAVPVKDFTGQIMGAVGISGPIWRMSEQVMQSRAKSVKAAANRLSAEFGAQSFAKPT